MSNKEIIQEIVEITEGAASGYEVITTSQRITLSIDSYQSCCENWGYFWCNDDVAQFVGAALHDVKLTDSALHPAKLPQEGVDPSTRYFEGGLMFVDLITDRGTLQFVAYNEHNGYYAHDASVKCSQLQHDETL